MSAQVIEFPRARVRPTLSHESCVLPSGKRSDREPLITVWHDGKSFTFASREAAHWFLAQVVA